MKLRRVLRCAAGFAVALVAAVAVVFASAVFAAGPAGGAEADSAGRPGQIRTQPVHDNSDGHSVAPTAPGTGDAHDHSGHGGHGGAASPDPEVSTADRQVVLAGFAVFNIVVLLGAGAIRYYGGGSQRDRRLARLADAPPAPQGKR